MDDVSANESSEPLTLVEIDSHRNQEERSRSGKSGEITYCFTYHREMDNKVTKGKVIEIGKLVDSNHMDLQPLSEEGYSHYGIFRVEDRSTTTIVQNKDGSTFKVYSFSRNDVKVSHPVSIAIVGDN